MTEPPPVDEEYAVKWFVAVRDLPPRSSVVAVQEFLHLGWTWNQIGPCTGLGFEDILSLLFRAMEALSETPEDIDLAQNLIRSCFTWPERFGYILERTRTGGGSIIRALDRAKELMPEAIPQARSTLVDFAAGTGWFLLEEENLPVWRAIARNGDALYRRLRGFTVPIESMKLLSGFLGSLESADQLEALLEDSIPSVIERIMGAMSREVRDDVILRLSSATRATLKRRAEQNLCMDLLAMNCEVGHPLECGRVLGHLTLFVGAGTATESNFCRVMDLCRHSGKDLEKIFDLARMVPERIGVAPYVPSDHWEPETVIEFFEISKQLIGSSDGTTRKKLNSIGHLMDTIFALDDPAGSVEILRGQLTGSATDPGLLLAASGLLFRSVQGAESSQVLPRCGRFANILSLLDTVYRQQVIEGGSTQWLAPLATSTAGTVDEVIHSLERIPARDLRGRFLEKVVAPLLEETVTNDPVFPEFLASAVHTYSSRDMSLDQLRNAELVLLRKLFRAEDRTRALRATMEKLLSIPGIEENRAGELIATARSLCEALSQQAVWLEKGGDVVYSRFLAGGLTAYMKTLLEYTDAADQLAGGLADELLGILMPTAETNDAQVAIWQLKTASAFFGRIIPLSVEILAGRPDILVPYLREMADLCMSSMHGEPAGAMFLLAAIPVLENRLMLEFERKLATDSAVEEVPEEIRGQVLMEEWISVRTTATAILKKAVKNLGPVTSQKTHRKILVREGKLLIEGLVRNGCEDLLKGSAPSANSRKEILRLRKAADGAELIDVFKAFESGEREGRASFPGVEGFFRSRKTPPGANDCRTWRKEVFSPLENTLIDVMMLYRGKKSLPGLDKLVGDFVEIIGFLGEDEEFTPANLFMALESSISSIEGVKPLSITGASRNIEKNIYRLLWRRKATSVTTALIMDLDTGRKALKSLFDRMSMEDSSRKQILFVKRYGRIFAALERSILQRKRSEIKTVRSVLDNLWLFNTVMEASDSPLENARDAVETYVQYFREIGARTGAVTSPEAGAISLGMRRRYRDNASTVAILLKWTQDPKREKLLELIETHHVLLEAVSRDVELIQLMDELWPNPQARKYMKALVDHPERLREQLCTLHGDDCSESSGLRYI